MAWSVFNPFQVIRPRLTENPDHTSGLRLVGNLASRNLFNVYAYVLTRLKDFLGDCPVGTISLESLEDYMIFLQNSNEQQRRDGKTAPLSGSTLQKHLMGLSLFFDWTTEVLDLSERPDEHLPRPARNSDMALPYRKEELDAILSAITRKIVVEPSVVGELQRGSKKNKKPTERKRNAYTTERPSKARDLALVFLLLDTGLTVSRACSLKVGDFLPADKKIRATHEKWTGQGMQQQVVLLALSDPTCQAISQYLTKRGCPDGNAPLFAGRGAAPLTYNAVRCLFLDLREIAGVSEITGSRFQCTFAVDYLERGEDPVSLKYILGHEYLDGVERFIEIWKATK